MGSTWVRIGTNHSKLKRWAVHGWEEVWTNKKSGTWVRAHPRCKTVRRSSEGHKFVENFFVRSLVDWKALQSCSYSSMKLIMHTMKPKWSRTIFVVLFLLLFNYIRFDSIHVITGISKFASDHLRSNSSDSFLNFVTTNLRFFLMKLNFVIYINNKYTGA